MHVRYYRFNKRETYFTNPTTQNKTPAPFVCLIYSIVYIYSTNCSAFLKICLLRAWLCENSVQTQQRHITRVFAKHGVVKPGKYLHQNFSSPSLPKISSSKLRGAEVSQCKLLRWAERLNSSQTRQRHLYGNILGGNNNKIKH